MYITSDGVQLRLSAKGSEAGVFKNFWTRVQTGSAGNDIFYSAYGDTDIGGAGDDSYYVWSTTNRIIEAGNNGVDTIFGAYWGTYTLAANVENLVLFGGGMTWTTGNDLANIMIAGTAASFLDGAGGNDVLVGGSGRDIFNVREGNGSDTVEHFNASLDQIRLEDYDVANYAALRGGMSQSGNDVIIRLPNAEAITIRDTAMSALSAADFVFANTSAVQTVVGSVEWPLPPLTLLPSIANVALNKGWIAMMNPWGVGGLGQGRDFTASTHYNASDLTHGTTFTWDFPTIATGPAISPKILAFPELIFGNSPKSGYSSNPGDTAHVFPARVDTIERLLLSHDLTFSGDTRGFNVSYDLWLANSTNGGWGSITNEIMIWLHQGDFPAFGTYLGTYEDGDFAATVYYSPGDKVTSFVANADLPSGTIDVAGILDWLQARGIVSPTEYFRDVELGAEVVSGAGSYTLNDLDLMVETRNADGSVTTKTVTGAGTTVTQGFTGTAGADTITGTAASNAIAGQDGNDIIDGGAAGDRLDGGVGWDTASFASAAARVSVNLSLQGQAQETGGSGADTLTNFEHLFGSAYDDRLIGDSGANRISGGAGDDWLESGGNCDILTGGAGSDVLIGGTGADRFVYAAVGDSRAGGADTIADLSAIAGDKIDLSAVDADALAAGTQHFRWVGTGAFAAAGDLRVSYGDGFALLSGDTNGDRIADFEIRLDGLDAGHPLAGWQLILA